MDSFTKTTLSLRTRKAILKKKKKILICKRNAKTITILRSQDFQRGKNHEM